ncbi:MAG: hypothetical protein QOG20_4191 [Pseudonocardiales bacterium]|nr:hypothetical protein [Pseudonocardiales bacterium]
MEVIAVRRIAMVVLLAVLLAGCADAAVAPGGATTPTTLGSPTTTDAPGRVVALPAYYVASTPAGFRLQREFHRVTTTDAASDAVREMFGAALDPDYRSYWPAGTALRSPVVAGDLITVDLTAQAAGPATDPAAARMSLQQLVYTVQGVLRSTLPVRVLVDGAPAATVLGGIDVSAPVLRGDAYAVRSLVQIDSPMNGASVERDVVVSGEAAVFEANLPWEVRREGVVVRSGAASTAEGQRFSPYSFTVTLEPGTYELRVTEDDPSDGAGRPPMTDTKTITVV